MTDAELRLKKFLATLSHMGWGLGTFGKPAPLRIGGRGEGSQASWVILVLPDGQALMLLALEGALPSPQTSFRRYEDLDPKHRAILEALSKQRLLVRYLVILGDTGAQLLDVGDEEVLVAAESGEETDDRLLPLLDAQAIVRGSLSSFPRKSTRQRADELAAWTKVWSTRLGGRLGLSAGAARSFFSWLHLARIAEINGIGPESSPRFHQIALTTRKTRWGRFLAQRFQPLFERWNLLQGGSLKSHVAIAEEAEKSGLLDECLESYSLVSRCKLHSSVLVESMADEDLRLISWRTSVVLPSPGDEGEKGPEDDSWLYDPAEIDLDREGYVLMLRRQDTLVKRVFDYAREQEASVERGERPGLQMDLLAAPPEDLTAEDATRHVLRHLLRVRTSQPARQDLARTALLARACEWDHKLKEPGSAYPMVDVRCIPFPAGGPPGEASGDPVLN